MAKASLKSLVDGAAPKETPPIKEEVPPPAPSYRTAKTRSDTRQIGGHFPPEVAQTLRLIAVEQDKDVQEMLAEALNMLFTRYGKPVRVEVTSGRRNRR